MYRFFYSIFGMHATHSHKLFLRHLQTFPFSSYRPAGGCKAGETSPHSKYSKPQPRWLTELHLFTPYSRKINTNILLISTFAGFDASFVVVWKDRSKAEMDLKELSETVQQRQGVTQVLTSPKRQIKSRFQLNLDKTIESCKAQLGECSPTRCTAMKQVIQSII